MSLITSIENIGTEVSALVALEPLIVKFVEDAMVAAPILEADGKAVLAKIESIFHATTPAASTSPNSPPPPPKLAA